MPIPPPRLETARLHIRPITATDLNDLMSVNGDPAVTRHLPYATWSSLDDAAAWLKRMEALQSAGTGTQLVVQDLKSNLVVGTVLLFKLDEGSSRVELGYALGRMHWRQGLMQEALSAVMGYCFSMAGIRRIEAEVNPDNTASNRLLVALGFTLEGRARQRWVAKGVAYDTHLYGILAPEWLAEPTRGEAV
jgi:[ribosomal protein S5]-alanine N-acetyltransferase